MRIITEMPPNSTILKAETNTISSGSGIPSDLIQICKMSNQVLNSDSGHLWLWLRHQWRKLLSIILAAGLLFILPQIIIVLIGFWILRIIVSNLAKIIRPDLATLMSLGSAPFATDLVYSKIPKIPLILAISLKGRLDIGVFRKAVSRLINSRDEKKQPCHPELQQYVTTWFGFIFWGWDTNFKVENHVNIYEEYAKKEKLRDGDLLEIGNKLLGQTFDATRSPWEFLVLYNYKDDIFPEEPRTLVILRTHHCLGDGFSLLKLFLVDLSGEKLVTAKPEPYKMKLMPLNINLCQKIIQAFCFPFRVAYELTNTAVYSWDINEWHIPEWKLTRKINGGVSVPIPLEYVKKIKNTHGTSFTAVPLAAFTGGIRNFMIARGDTFPDAIHCLAVLPYPGHPWKLRNHLTGCMIRLPLELPTAKERLETIEKTLLEIKSSTLPTTLFYLLKIAGIPFAFIGYIFFRNLLTTAVNSNFPGPDVETKFVGLPIQDCGFAVGFGSGNTVIGLGSLSYNGNIRLTAGFDEAILPSNVHFKDLMDKIIEELKILERTAPEIKQNLTANDGEDLNRYENVPNTKSSSYSHSAAKKQH